MAFKHFSRPKKNTGPWKYYTMVKLIRRCHKNLLNLFSPVQSQSNHQVSQRAEGKPRISVALRQR